MTCNQMRSSIEQEFFKLLDDENIKIVSFDIFDTLALRDVQKPEQIFLRVGEKSEVLDIFDSPLSFKNFRVEAEKVAREKHPQYEDIKLEWIYDVLPISQGLKKKILEYEIEEERKSVFINKQIARWMEEAYERGKRVVLVSDMYLSSEQIEHIVLSKLGEHRKLISGIYLSSEYHKLKATGNLFKVVKEKENVDFNQMLHIGNHYVADFLKPSDLGIKSILYEVDNYVQDVFELESNLLRKNWGISYSIRRLACLLNPYTENESEKRFFFNLGAYLFGPVLWEFSHWLKDLVYKKGIRQVNFIMREGKIFQEYFKKVAPEINTNLLFISRRSLLLPILNAEKIVKELVEKRRFNEILPPLYKFSTLKEIYEVLKLKLPDNLKNYSDLTFSQLCVSEDSNGRNLMDIIAEDLSNRIGELKENAKKQKEFLKRYLSEVGVEKGALFVDFGGGGSILRGLHCVLEERNRNENFYAMFFTTDRGYKNMMSMNYYSFLHKRDRDRSTSILERTCHVLECLLNGVEPTTLGYEEQKGEITPVTRNPLREGLEKEEFERIKGYIRSFKEGIDAFFELCQQYKINGVLNRSEIAAILERFLEIPTEEEAEFVGKLYSDDGKEKLELKRIISDENLKTIALEGVEKFYIKFMHNNSFKQEECYWPQGTITLLNPVFISLARGIRSRKGNEEQVIFLIRILNENKFTRVNVYGAGEFFKMLEPRLREYGIDIVNVYDSRAYVKSFKVGKYNVKPFDVPYINSYPVVIASASFVEEIVEHIDKILKKIGKCVYVIDVERGMHMVGNCGKQMYNKE